MIILDATTRSLEIDLNGAVTTNQLPFVASYVDVSQSTFAVSAMATNTGASNNTTAVTLVAAPGASTSRVLKHLSIKNSDTVATLLWVQMNDNSTLREIWKGTLAVGDSLIYTDASGWTVLNSSGQVKTGSGISSIGASTDNAIVRWDGTGGTAIQNSGWTLDDSNVLTAAGNVSLGANYISRAGTAAGFSLDASNNATFSARVNFTSLLGEATTGSAFVQYSPNDTRIINLNASGNIVFRDQANSVALLTVTNAGNLTVSGATITASASGARIFVGGADPGGAAAANFRTGSTDAAHIVGRFGTNNNGASTAVTIQFVEDEDGSPTELGTLKFAHGGVATISADGGTVVSGTLTVSGTGNSNIAGRLGVNAATDNTVGLLSGSDDNTSGTYSFIAYNSTGLDLLQIRGDGRCYIYGQIIANNGTITTGSTTALSLATSGGTQVTIANDGVVTTTGPHRGSEDATAGPAYLYGALSSGNSLVVGGRYSSAGMLLGYGAKSDTVSSGFVSIYGNGAIQPVVLTLEDGSARFFTAALATTAVGSAVSLYEQVRITHTASATNYATLTGSNGGDPNLSASGGNISLGAASAVATTATAGLIRIPTCAGTPTGAVADGNMVIDTTNHKLYFRSGATWRDAGP